MAVAAKLPSPESSSPAESKTSKKQEVEDSLTSIQQAKPTSG
jgi:hypothetical protein